MKACRKTEKRKSYKIFINKFQESEEWLINKLGIISLCGAKQIQY